MFAVWLLMNISGWMKKELFSAGYHRFLAVVAVSEASSRLEGESQCVRLSMMYPSHSSPQVREREQPMLVCLRSLPGCVAWGSCVVCCVATGSPRRLTGTCRFMPSSLVVFSVLTGSDFFLKCPPGHLLMFSARPQVPQPLPEGQG